MGQVPSLYEMDGFPDCGDDRRVLLAVLSEYGRRICGSVYIVHSVGSYLYCCGRALLGTFHRNVKRYLPQRQSAYYRAFVLYGRRGNSHSIYSYYNAGTNLGG